MENQNCSDFFWFSGFQFKIRFNPLYTFIHTGIVCFLFHSDFIKVNGMCIVPKLMSSDVSELRWRCLELLGTLAQNNPFVQNKLITLKLMPALLTLVDTDPNPTVRVKAMYAISCKEVRLLLPWFTSYLYSHP